jgi:hypothetical protein
VVEFLSDAWIERMDAAARAADDLASDEPFVVETEVHPPDGSAGAGGHQVGFGPDGARVTRAGLPPDVVLVTDRATAWALHQGTLRAQDAFARGVLKVRGRPEVLVAHADVLAAFERAVAPVRADTSAPPGGSDAR